MQLKNIAVKNFRLLHDAGLLLEKQTIVIVGRNNSGKTSLTEVIKRLLGDGNPSFRLEDFSFATCLRILFCRYSKGHDKIQRSVKTVG